MSSATVTNNGSHPFVKNGNFQISGEIITWHMHRLRVGYNVLRKALDDAGLPSDTAREMLPRHAFARAARELSENRIIRKFEESEGDITFQFTREYREENGFTYDKEAVLSLSKYTGAVWCKDNPLLAQEAERLIDEKMGYRTGNDVAAVLKRLFKKYADIFPFRHNGGVYFVPLVHLPFVDQIEKVVDAVGGSVRRLPVPKGIERGDKAIREVVSDGLQETCQELLDAVEALDFNAQDANLNRKARQIKELRFKVESFATYLGDNQDKLMAFVDKVNARLVEKTAQIQGTEAA